MTPSNNHSMEHRLLYILGPLMLLAPLSIDMYVPFMPQLAQEFQASGALVQMTITIPMLMMGFGQIFWGILCDYFGRVPALYTTLGIFIAGSLSCCLFTGITPFIAARIFQAFAVCGAQVMALSIARDLTDGHQTQRLFSRLLGLAGTAPIFAPYLAAVMVGATDGWWRAIFLFLAVYTVFCTILATRLPKKELQEIQQGHHKPAFSLRALFSDLGKIMAQKNFQRWAAIPMLVMTGLFLFVAMSTHYFQTHVGYSPKGYGLILALNALCYFLASFFSGSFHRRMGDQHSIFIGLSGVIVAQFAHAAYWALAGQSAIVFFLSVLLSSICYGLIYGAAVRLSLEGLGKNTGLATSLLGLLQFAAASLVTSVAVVPPLSSPLSFMLPILSIACWALWHTAFLTAPKRQDKNGAAYVTS